MSSSLDKKEIYLYGTLLALIREQLESVDKVSGGKLGFWGKNRMQARNKEIDKFLRKIIEHKFGQGFSDPLEQILSDLELIRNDNNVWGDISTNQLEYISNILNSLLSGG